MTTRISIYSPRIVGEAKPDPRDGNDVRLTLDDVGVRVNREAIHDLFEVFVDAYEKAGEPCPYVRADLQAATEQPTQPDEPRGTGAVVEVDGTRWVNVDPGVSRGWFRADYSTSSTYSHIVRPRWDEITDLGPVTVLHEGMQP